MTLVRRCFDEESTRPFPLPLYIVLELSDHKLTHTAINCPVLVVSAAQDYTPTSYKEAYAARMARAELVVIPDSRHLTPVD